MKKSRRNKNTKKNNKSRKFRGGNIDTSGYVLAGFLGDYNNVCRRSPIFLFKERSLKNSLPHTILYNNNNTPNERRSIFIQVLYDLNFRGLHIATIMSHSNQMPSDYQPNNRNIYFYDGKELIYPGERGILFGWGPSGLTHSMNKEEQTRIKNMELKYPGLFQRMFVTEEEEQDALERVREKESLEADSNITYYSV